MDIDKLKAHIEMLNDYGTTDVERMLYDFCTVMVGEIHLDIVNGLGDWYRMQSKLIESRQEQIAAIEDYIKAKEKLDTYDIKL
jgi:hypothetical protein